MLKNRSWRKIFGVGVVVCSVAFLALGIRAIRETYFNRATWMTHPKERYKMVGDLRNHYLKSGMTSIQVVQLIGPEDYLENDNRKFSVFLDADPRFGLTIAQARKTKFIFYYDLGYGYGFGEPIAMCLSFDTTGKLVRAWQMGR